MPTLAVSGGRLAYADRGRGAPVTACHGFALAGPSWWEVVAAAGGGWRWLLPDLRGHGATAVPPEAPHGLAAIADDLIALWDALGIARSHLVGYSMGGRAALTLAVRAPARLRSLTIVSAHAGLADDQRPARRAADDHWRAILLERGTDRFAGEWERLPLVSGIARRSDRVQARLGRIRRRNRAAGLAASLRDAGAGAMAPVWEQLAAVACPALIIAGADDPRYRAHAERLAAVLPRAELAILPRCGHAVPAERPMALAERLAAFLERVEAAG